MMVFLPKSRSASAILTRLFGSSTPSSTSTAMQLSTFKWFLPTQTRWKVRQQRGYHQEPHASLTPVMDFSWFLPMQTRCKDNDVYGHVNNAVYHAMFDTAINVYLIRYCGLDMSLDGQGLVGYMVRTECLYSAPISYPNLYLSGMKVTKIGNSSVDYELGLFAPRDPKESVKTDCVLGHFAQEGEVLGRFWEETVALGRYTHVFVDPRKGNKPTRISDEMREGLERIRSQVDDIKA